MLQVVQFVQYTVRQNKYSPHITNAIFVGSCSTENKISSFLLSLHTECVTLFFTNRTIFYLKDGKNLQHVYLRLPVPCTPIITIYLIPFISSIYGMPEISLNSTNSPIIFSFKFSIASPFPKHISSSVHITFSSLHSAVRG